MLWLIRATQTIPLRLLITTSMTGTPPSSLGSKPFMGFFVFNVGGYCVKGYLSTKVEYNSLKSHRLSSTE